MLEFLKPTIQEDKIDRICFNLMIIDIFFIPLFPWFSISVSLPVLIYWYIIRWRRTTFEKERKYLSIVLVLMFCSTLFSVFGFEDSLYNTTFETSCKRFLQYLFSFWYFFFFLYFFTKYDRKINTIVLYEIIYITLFAILYLYDKDIFIQLKQILCPFDPQINRWLNNELLVYRFNFLWADPNNVAYAVTSLSLFYLIEEKGSIITKYIVLCCLSFILLCTMSIGGIIVSFGLITYIILFSKAMKEGKYSIIIGIIVILIICFLIYYNLDFFKEIYESGILQRKSTYGDQGLEGGGGRWNDFLRGLNALQPLFLVVGSGQEGFVTEIGHLYLICMYGIPVYIYFMYILFGKREGQKLIEYLTIVPIFIGFTINIAIGEQKFLLIALLIAAYYASRPYKKNYKIL